MFQIDDDDFLDRTLLTIRIIVGALVAGLVFFLAITLFVRLQPPPKPSPFAPAPTAEAAAAPKPFLTYVAVGFAAAPLPLSILMPRVVTGAARRRIADGSWVPPRTGPEPITTWNDRLKLLSLYPTQLIVGAAINEFTAFFAGISYLIEGQPLALGLMALLILGVLARFPTRDRLERWIDAQLALIQEARQLG